MKTIIGVRFRTGGKVYYFDPGRLQIKKGDHVIVETARGVEYGTVVCDPKEIEDEKFSKELKTVMRVSTEKDDERDAENRVKEKDAIPIAKEKIRARGLEMKLIDVEYTFDRNKIVFYFTADGRVDFRELVKDLAGVFRTRIELRQIGVRDATKLLGGLGSCGRVLCCHSYMNDFIPVSIRMAKEQNLSLNPGKISGMCGRLMCCLQYEADTYAYLNKKLPRVGDEVITPYNTTGVVQSVDVLRQRVQLIVEVGDEKEMEEYPVEELKFTKRSKGGKNKKPGKDQNREKLSKEELKELEKLEKSED
ncbi:MAG: stage 0 sporulation family protein [Lachnospiraceae bacterium]|nr:stage 0 sporulation family protein [Lachnospiraceae bacterium]